MGCGVPPVTFYTPGIIRSRHQPPCHAVVCLGIHRHGKLRVRFTRGSGPGRRVAQRYAAREFNTIACIRVGRLSHRTKGVGSLRTPCLAPDGAHWNVWFSGPEPFPGLESMRLAGVFSERSYFARDRVGRRLRAVNIPELPIEIAVWNALRIARRYKRRHRQTARRLNKQRQSCESERGNSPSAAQIGLTGRLMIPVNMMRRPCRAREAISRPGRHIACQPCKSAQRVTIPVMGYDVRGALAGYTTPAFRSIGLHSRPLFPWSRGAAFSRLPQ